MTTADNDIRPVLKAAILDADPAVALFDELPLLRGNGRADVAAVNGHLVGYEIKSDRDSLIRLPAQIAHYDQIFEQSVLVVAKKHLERARRILPKHWGIMVVDGTDAQLKVRSVRTPKPNKQWHADSVIRLMWKTEIAQFLRSQGISFSRMAGVASLWNIMQSLPQQQVLEAARNALKARTAMQSPSPPSQDGG